ncbi:SIS domain-containing protein [Carnobacterium sp.]|uniref:MurR/RpiR family transcriptional regulator n=2 Tax=Carnobacteriaceae TaxID=186828 RepID=UPI002FCADE1D
MNIPNLTSKYNLNEIDQTILLFIENNATNVKALGIRGVAKNCFTSTATIVNLAKKMNLSGYSELVFKIKENSLNDGNTSQESEKMQSDYMVLAKRYFPEFKKIIDEYLDETIMILGSGFSQIIANYINEALVLKGIRSITNSHLELIRPVHARKTLLVVVTESGETSRLKELVKEARENDIEVVSFVGNAQSIIGTYSRLCVATNDDVQFSTNPYEPHLFYGGILLIFEWLWSTYLKQSIS